jgi:transcription antitermination factor NusG
LASSALRAKGFEEFLPQERKQRRWSDRVQQIEQPLFPGYVFCRFDVAGRVPVLQSPGVVGVVSFGSIPAAIPEEEIQAVRRMIDSSLPLQPYPFLPTGTRVRLEKGPLAGMEGTVVEAKKGFRLVASITLLQRSITVEIDRAWIRPVN